MTDDGDQARLKAMPEDWERALCVVAHPDDVEYGAAGAVATWTAAGKQVAYLLVTRGEAGIDGIPPDRCGSLREAEQRTAAAEVGVSVVEFLDHADGTIEADLALRRDLAAAFRRHRPELVVTLNHHDGWAHGGWNSPDHRAVGRTVLDARGDAGNRWIFPDAGERWDGIRWVAVSGSPHPTHFVAVDHEGFEASVRSLEAHAAYLDALGGDMADARKFLTRFADQTGRRAGVEKATAFELLG